VKATPILSADEIRQLTRLHAQIGALLASNGAAARSRGRAGSKAKGRPARDDDATPDDDAARLRGRGDFGPADG
jgi:hypothetical protein